MTLASQYIKVMLRLSGSMHVSHQLRYEYQVASLR